MIERQNKLEEEANKVKEQLKPKEFAVENIDENKKEEEEEQKEKEWKTEEKRN